MKKMLGYILMLIGAFGIIISLEVTKKFLPAIIPEGISSSAVLIVGAVLLILGAFMSFKSTGSKKQPQEVPIYQGNQIIGYRRV